MHTTTIKEEDRLQGVDNFALWDRTVQAALGEDGRIDHITKDISELELEIVEDYPQSLVPTPTELSKRRVAMRQLGKERVAAFSTIYNGLSKTVQNKLPKSISSFLSPTPKELYEYLKTTHGATSGTRQAELWAAIWGTQIAENEDPEPKLAAIRANLAEVVESASTLTLDQFAENIGAYAAIRVSLPPTAFSPRPSTWSITQSHSIR